MTIPVGTATSAEDAMAVIAASKPPLTSPTQSHCRTDAHLRPMYESARRRPEWTWITRDGDGPEAPFLAVAAAMGVTASAPTVLDLLGLAPGVGLDHPAVAELLRTATAHVVEMGVGDACIFAPPDHGATHPEVAPSVRALEDAGWRLLVERYHYEFPPPADLGRDTPLTLQVEQLDDADDPRFLTVYRELLEGSLDAHDLALVGSHGIDEAARRGVASLLEADPVECHHLALDASGNVVGTVSVATVPSGRGFLAHVGVSHRHRGHGYGRQLVGWGSRWLVSRGATIVAADTDATNVPMTRAFADVGWPVTERRLDFTPRRRDGIS